jgi:hypothetical protein
MKIALLLARIIGMGFVIVSCMAFITRMTMVGRLTDQWGYLVVIVAVSAGLVYWAYRVIWCPIRPATNKE